MSQKEGAILSFSQIALLLHCIGQCLYLPSLQTFLSPDWLSILRLLEKSKLSEAAGHDALLCKFPKLAKAYQSRSIHGKVKRKTTLDNFRKTLETLSSSKTEFTFYGSALYPLSLYDLRDPPFGLFYHGDITRANDPSVSIVGSRKASHSACRISEDLGFLLARNKINVVSGGALGCDIHAHVGALATKEASVRATIVLAGGFQHLYPKKNQDVFEALIERNALFLTEKLPHTPSKAIDFPLRNRIIAALAKELVVVQCAIQSGAMNSVSHALKLGRDVHVYRQRDDVRFEGCEKLIFEGAPFFESAEEYVWGRT